MNIGRSTRYLYNHFRPYRRGNESFPAYVLSNEIKPVSFSVLVERAQVMDLEIRKLPHAD